MEKYLDENKEFIIPTNHFWWDERGEQKQIFEDI